MTPDVLDLTNCPQSTVYLTQVTKKCWPTNVTKTTVYDGKAEKLLHQMRRNVIQLVNRTVYIGAFLQQLSRCLLASCVRLPVSGDTALHQ